MTQIEVQLDDFAPLSVNHAWKGRRFKTGRYNVWREIIELTLPKKKMITGNVSITVHFCLIHCLTTDLDNLLKTLFDSLVNKGYIEDDRNVIEIIARKEKAKKNSIYFAITKST